jgi:hypothetical protein
MKLEFSGQFFEKYISYFTKKNLPMGTELLPADRRTERHDAASSHFSQFFERA